MDIAGMDEYVDAVTDSFLAGGSCDKWTRHGRTGFACQEIITVFLDMSISALAIIGF